MPNRVLHPPSLEADELNEDYYFGLQYALGD
jgi:hypothetical protein